MSKQPYLPRKSPMTENGFVSRDWDASCFQPLVQTVNTLTPAGTYADNIAALAAGLLVGQVYQTAAGALRIVV